MEERFEYSAETEETYAEIWDKEKEESYSEFDEICNLLNKQEKKIGVDDER